MKSKTGKEVRDSNYFGMDNENVIYSVYFFFYFFIFFSSSMTSTLPTKK